MNLCKIVTFHCELLWDRIPGKKAPAAVALQWYKPDGDVLPAPISPNQPRWGQSHQPSQPRLHSPQNLKAPHLVPPPSNHHQPTSVTPTFPICHQLWLCWIILSGVLRLKAVSKEKQSLGKMRSSLISNDE